LFFTAVIEERRLLGYKNPDFTSQETHYAPLQSPAAKCCVRFDVFTAVTVKNVVFWDKKQCSYLTGDIFLLRYRAQPVNTL
jgi:hypothetical protein